MCRIALGVLWYNSTHPFTIESVVVPQKSLWNSKKICSVTLAVISTNSTHGFTLISYLFYFQEHSNHEFTQITLLLARKSLWEQ